MAGRLLDYAGPVLRAARERAGATQRDQLVDAIVDAYCVVTGVPRLELLERATADWQKSDYGEVKGL